MEKSLPQRLSVALRYLPPAQPAADARAFATLWMELSSPNDRVTERERTEIKALMGHVKGNLRAAARVLSGGQGGRPAKLTPQAQQALVKRCSDLETFLRADPPTDVALMAEVHRLFPEPRQPHKDIVKAVRDLIDEQGETEKTAAQKACALAAGVGVRSVQRYIKEYADLESGAGALVHDEDRTGPGRSTSTIPRPAGVSPGAMVRFRDKRGVEQSGRVDGGIGDRQCLVVVIGQLAPVVVWYEDILP
jgi:hypothetical protein